MITSLYVCVCVWPYRVWVCVCVHVSWCMYVWSSTEYFETSSTKFVGTVVRIYIHTVQSVQNTYTQISSRIFALLPLASEHPDRRPTGVQLRLLNMLLCMDQTLFVSIPRSQDQFATLNFTAISRAQQLSFPHRKFPEPFKTDYFFNCEANGSKILFLLLRAGSEPQ
jgi:hypothetical protein